MDDRYRMVFIEVVADDVCRGVHNLPSRLLSNDDALVVVVVVVGDPTAVTETVKAIVTAVTRVKLDVLKVLVNVNTKADKLYYFEAKELNIISHKGLPWKA